MKQVLDAQKQLFNDQVTKSYAFRFQQLSKLKEAISKRQYDITQALKDLGKSSFEAYATEIGYTLKSIQFTQKD